MKRRFRLVTPFRVRPDVAGEIDFHMEMRARELIAAGMPPEEARREAAARFGDVGAVTAACEATRQGQLRERERADLLRDLWQDIGFAARTLRKTPVFTVAAVLTLAFGIGANTAIFSVISGVLLRPLPYEHGDRLLTVTQPDGATGAPDMAFSALEVADYRDRSHSLDALAEYHSMAFTLLGHGDPMRVQTGVVSASYFDVMGIRPLLGRTFREGEDAKGAAPVLVLSYEFWQHAFGGDPTIVGRTFEMNDRVHTVVGVLPPIPQEPDQNDVFMPISSCPFRSSPQMADKREMRMVNIFARLRPGASVVDARRDLTATSSELHRAHPESFPNGSRFSVTASLLRDEMTRRARPTFLVLLATAGFVLLIACANVANLTLARRLQRQRELAVRAALGAGRGRIFRQLMTESTLLALAGGVAGLLVAIQLTPMLIGFAARFTPRAQEISIDWRVLAFTFVVSLACGVALGSLPGLADRQNLVSGLKDGSAASTSGRSGRRIRGALIVSQVAIAFVLLIGAGLMLRSFVNLVRVNPGFDPERVLTARVDLNWTRYDSAAKVRAFTNALLARLGETPGVVAVASASSFPLNHVQPFANTFLIEGRFVPKGEPQPSADAQAVSPEYFTALGIPLLRGRVFTETDRDGAEEVAVVTAGLARRYWRDREPIGERITFDEGKHWVRIVGVVGDVKQYGLEQEPTAGIYVPFDISPVNDLRVVIESRGDPAALEQRLRAATRDLDGMQPVTEVETLVRLRDDSLASPRLTTLLLGSFAALALLITTAGLAGVITFSVSQRTREIGIRMALGAERMSVLALVLRQGLGLVAIGLVLGVGGALLMTRLISGLLFQVRASDPLTFAAVALVLLMVGILACLAPARRAATVDPTIALKGA
ncbi:MAG TPA: ABC transporter permease [Gemmatimonadaceae bacterium]|nr:ABC transporter permease [Gemmatimonadaceae bacterium]